MFRAILPFLTFALRHFFALALCFLAGCMLWTVAYIALLIIAMLGNYGIGGPLAFPAGIISVLVACVIIGGGIFAPASGIGAIFCSVFHLPRIVAIPVVFISAFLICHFLSMAWIGFATTHPMPPARAIFKNFSLFLSIPLGMYWWLTEGSGTMIDSIRRYLEQRTLKPKKNHPASSELFPLP